MGLFTFNWKKGDFTCMKSFLLTLLAMGCAAVLIAGNLHWQEKTTVSAEKLKVKQVVFNTVAQNELDTDKTIQLTQHWPAEAQASYQQALADERPFTILLAGSLTVGSDEESWSSLVKHELEQAYGETLNIVVKSYDLTSAQFTKEKLPELLAEQPDLTLFEPFTLNDNDKVRIEDSHQHIAEIASSLLEVNPQHVLLLQPPYPLYQANYYPVQVTALKRFAKKNSIPYLDHWTAWPDPDSKDIKQYLDEVNGSQIPNESGHQLWASYLAEYFISK